MKRQAENALWAVALGLAATACAESPSQTPIRSLQSSGPVSFVCLGAPGELAEMGRPLSDCSAVRTNSTSDYVIPHLYALVTQPINGEVAVVDLTTDSEAVLDQDPSVPGANFLPVGAAPTDIVSTPGGMASFVAAAEPRFEGIYALPSDMIRGSRAQLSSWPACRLPAAPGRMLLVLDPPDDAGATRPTCDAAYGTADDAVCFRNPDDAEPVPHCHGDLAVDAATAGEAGRYKLIVTLPSEGGFAVLDAQSILDRPAGEFAPCAIERWVPLEVAIATAPREEPADTAAACVEPMPVSTPYALGFTPLPAGLARDDRRLYIADRGAPVIHRIDMPTPCEPVELPPLLTSSREDPERVVFTSDIAVSPVTMDLERYLYALDEIDGSIMAYDISDGGSNPRPLERSSPETNPFQPPDRVRFQAPVREILILQHQNDLVDPDTGATLPVRCDPDPSSDGPGAIYRTGPGFDRGAGPTRLRGVFAFALLTSGHIAVIDIDDWDAPCRGPKNEHPLFGCDDPLGLGLATSGEFSCNTVQPHQPRSALYLITAETIASNQPAVASLPRFFDDEGTLVPLDGEENPPRMRATVPVVDPSSIDFNVAVGTELRPLSKTTGLLLVSTDGEEVVSTEHTLAMNLADPRAHTFEQAWNVAYEGGIPNFAGRFATLSDVGGGRYELSDVGSRFCSSGVQSKNALVEKVLAEGGSDEEAESEGTTFADYVQIASDTPVETDPYWSAPPAECAGVTFQGCEQAFGTSISPRGGRDLRVVEATQDTLLLEHREDVPSAPLTCCFPHVVEFRVRPQNQWIVVGDQIGFLHHMTTSATGVCRPSCDPARALLNGRVRETPPDTLVEDDDPGAFSNPYFRFAINRGTRRRDSTFRFSTQNAFRPLTLAVGGGQTVILPTAASYLETTGELVVSDGGFEGITLLNLNSLQITRQYN